MRFRPLGPVLATLLALGAAGVLAETTEGATIPKAKYVKRADAICLDVATKAVALQSEARRRIGAATSRAEVRGSSPRSTDASWG